MGGKVRRALGGPRWLWALVIVALPLAALAERGFRSAYTRLWAPTGTARWIWAGGAESIGGVAFFTFRDFELSSFPGRARISCRADEEYFLYLNGVLVGAGRYRDGEPLATYEVGYLLEPGRNRVAAEIRSGRGVGGFLLDLRIEGQDSVRIGSDEEWSVVQLYTDGLLASGSEVPGAEPAHVWSAPPVGRWGLPRLEGATLGFDALVVPGSERHAPRARSDRTHGRWRDLAPPNVSSPPLGRTVTFDWGREVIGYANVVFGRKEGGKALVFAGVEPPDVEVDAPAAYLLNPPGRKSWSDTQPRRFRYLTVVATAEMVGARVLPVVPEFAASALAAVAPPSGVFGLAPLELRPPIEDEIRSELESLAGVADGEGV